MIKIFLGGFPLDMDEMSLVQIVSPYGQVETIKIVRDKKTKICKGYAFLEITDLDGADNIVDNVDGIVIAGRPLKAAIVWDK